MSEASFRTGTMIEIPFLAGCFGLELVCLQFVIRLRSILASLKTIPFLDSVGTPLLAGMFLALLWLQSRFPLRHQHFVALRRLVRNLVLSAPSNAVFRWLMLPVPLAIASW